MISILTNAIVIMIYFLSMIEQPYFYGSYSPFLFLGGISYETCCSVSYEILPALMSLTVLGSQARSGFLLPSLEQVFIKVTTAHVSSPSVR